MQKSFAYLEAKSKAKFWEDYTDNLNFQKIIPNFSVGYLDAKSKAIVWRTYAESFSNMTIMEEGYNPNSGYVYIALEIGVTIASAFGHEAEFIIYDYETGEENFLESLEELNQYLQNHGI